MRASPLLAIVLCACAAPKDVPPSARAQEAASKPPRAPAAKSQDPSSQCPDGMVYISPATFTMGMEPEHGYNTDPLHQVTITKPYCIDRTPVTVAAYRKCVDAQACTEAHKPLDYNYGRPGRDDHPVNGVDWFQADAYCKWANKRLPTDAQWELAARGTDGRRYPWGNQEPDDTRLHWSKTHDREQTAPVGSYPAGASPYGVLDMLGNVVQWVADSGGKGEGASDVAPTEQRASQSRVSRGSGYDQKLGMLHAAKRGEINPQAWGSDLGFRCAR